MLHLRGDGLELLLLRERLRLVGARDVLHLLAQRRLGGLGGVEADRISSILLV